MARGPAAVGDGDGDGDGQATGRTAGQRTEQGNLWIGRTGARGRRWDQWLGAGEDKIEGPSAATAVVCKRADVHVGLCHHNERQACLNRQGGGGARPVARGSVCQIQVVSNHRSGVAARNHPFWRAG